MKTLLFNCLFILLLTSIHAQERFQEINHYKLFKVQVDAGYARPAGKGVKSGLLLALEPKFNINDRISIGLRTEATAMARGGYSINNVSAEAEVGLGIAILPTADYYFSNRLARPYVGIGLGLYNFVSVQASTVNTQVSIPAVSKPGVFLRTGVEVWHIRAGFVYNLVGKSKSINNSYYGLTLGFIIGGGVKDEYKGTE
jgi:outer membrane protein X